jgi:hypothetical protein
MTFVSGFATAALVLLGTSTSGALELAAAVP